MQNKIALYIALLLLAGGVWLFYQNAGVSSRDDDAPLYSSERYDPYGTAALRDLLAERGVHVGELRRPYPDAATGTTLVQVLPVERPLFRRPESEPTSQRLRDWIAQGNTVIQFTRGSTDLMAAYGLTIPQPIDRKVLDDIQAGEFYGKSEEKIGAAEEDGRWIGIPAETGRASHRDERRLQLLAPAVIKPGFSPVTPATGLASATAPARIAAVTGSSDWHPLVIRQESNDWLAAVRPVGNGRLIVVGAPTPVLNGTIQNDANLEFVLALLGADGKSGGGPVLFDEWSHNIGHVNTIMGFIREIGLLPVLVQLLVAIIFYVWGTSGFRPKDARVSRRRRSSAEQIETLGYLYSQSLKPHLVFEKVHAEVYRRLGAALHCSPAGVEAQLRQANPEVVARANELFATLAGIGRGQGPTCPACGYDLTHNTSGKCPECGSDIPLALRDRIAAANTVAALPVGAKKQKKLDSRLAAVLCQSHAFVQELTRARNHRR